MRLLALLLDGPYGGEKIKIRVGASRSSQELLPKYTEQERQLTCPEGVCVQAVFQQPELRGMSARARPRVTLRMVLVLFAELFFLLWISIVFCARPC